ncbi:MAG TPA: HEAT repeat domain-containing protein [Planctomycetota bacterium]|nr:HEAT repeat domain-containing protein [Planctomycetota bacterium]
MQEDSLEVTFCDLCGASVPVADLSSGAAVRHLGKTVGACCMPALGGASTHVAAPVAGARSAGAQAHLLPVAVVLLAAVASATIFLDQKISGADKEWRASHEQIKHAQRSDSDVLQNLGVAMDQVARKADLEDIKAKLAQVEGDLKQAGEQLRSQQEPISKELASLRKEIGGVLMATNDLRPLFDELRQKQQRVAELLVALEKEGPRGSAPASAEPAAPAAAPAETPGAPALPEALAEQVKKLKSADPAVRFEAVDELLRSKNALILPHLLPIARDADSFVRRLTVEGLRDFKKPEVVEALLVALTDNDDLVSETAWRSLKEVTGQKIPFEASGTKDARARAVQRWQEWWEKNKATFGT